MSNASLFATSVRKFFAALAFTVLAIASSIGGAAPAGADEFFTYTLVNNSTEAQITGCVSTCPTQLVIPTYVDNYRVTRIGVSAFAGKGLTSVTFPDGLQRILGSAFYQNSLTQISIPSSVTLIGHSPFAENRLTFVNLPAQGSLTTIGPYAFSANQLTDISIPSTVTIVDTGAFNNNCNLTSVSFRGNAPTAGTGPVFANCNSLQTVQALTGTSGWGSTWSGIPVSIGNGTPTASATPAPTVLAPNPPTINAVTAGNGQLSINFTAPLSNGGASITNYQYSLNNGATWQTPSPAKTSSPLVVSGLTNGTAYSVSLRAVNSAGPGFQSTSVSASPATPVSTPGSPSISSIETGDGQLSINFTAPTSDGGSAITNYEYSLDGGTNWIASDATTSPIVVSGLTNGTAYSVKLRAVNSVGSGSANVAVSVIPTLSADGFTFRLDGDGNATVTGCVGSCPAALVIPSSLGGHPVTSTGDQAFAEKGLTSLTIPASVTRMGWAGFISNSLTSVTFLGNAPFDPTVVFDGNGSLSAVDVQFGTTGWGATFSDVPVHVVPIAPGAPTVYSFTGGNGQATVTFTEPASTGGSAITNYLVEYKPTSDSSWTTFSHDASASTLSYVISGLTNGTSYDVRVSAVNTVGTSSASAASSATLGTTPSAPTVDSVTAGNAQVTVAFTAPSSDGGSPVTSYEYSLDDGFSWVSAAPTSSPIVVTGLTNGTTYSVKLRAVNDVGAGSANTAVSATPVTTPGAPTVDSVTAGNAQVTVAFTAPSSDGGSSITDYLVEYKLTSDSSWTTWSHDVSASTRSYTVTGLTNGSTYDVRVAAVNAVGTGNASSTSSATPVTGRPAGAPTIRTNVIGNGRVTLGISAPNNTGGTSITGYEYTVDGGATWLPVDSSSTSTSLLIAGLQNGTTYVVKVRARNGAGGGAASKTRTVTPRTVAGAPTITALVARSGNITVSFAAPESNGGSAITRYGYSVNGGAFVMFIPSGYSKVIKALKNGVVYSVRIKALNAAGWSEASNAVEATPNK